MITKEEERELIRRFQQDGDEAARDALIEAHKRFVYQNAGRLKHRMDRKDLDIDDVAQVGLISMWNAISCFDLSRDVRFLTYAGWGIRRSITKALMGGAACTAGVGRGLHELLGKPDSMSLEAMRDANDGVDEIAETDEANPGDSSGRTEINLADQDDSDCDWDLIQKHTFLRESLAELTERERHVIERRCLGESLVAIAAGIGVCKERVRQNELSAISKLRRLAGDQTATPAGARRNLEKNPNRVLGYVNGHQRREWKSKMLDKMRDRNAKD